jgi:hypothetical protein
MKQIILQIMNLTMALFLTGCGQSSDPRAPVKKLFKPSADTDVTSSPWYNFSSFSGTVWKTKVKTAIAEGKRYTGAPETSLVAPRRFDTADPNYRRPNDTRIITVLPVGIRVRIERLMKDNGAWGGVNVTATVEDGTNAPRIVFLDGAMLASNQYLGTEVTKSTNWGVNPEMLEAVTDDLKK